MAERDTYGQPTLEAVYEGDAARLIRALTLVAGDRGRAADAVHEAFLRAHVRWRRVSRLEDPTGWVRRVALNLVLDERRRQRRLTSEPAGDHPAPEPPELAVDVVAAVAALPAQQRAAVALHYLADLPVREVAGALGVTEGTARSHLHHGRTALARVLGGTDA